MTSQLDLESFRLVNTKKLPTTATTSTTLRKARRKGWFLKGPIEGYWLEQASSPSGKALHVGMAIWFKSGLTKSRKVKVTSKTRKKFGLDRHAYLRGLNKLEDAGLVSVKRHQGQCAEITLIV